MNNRYMLAVVMLGWGSLVGCSDDLGGPNLEASGRIEAFVRDNPNSSSANLLSSQALGLAPFSGSAAANANVSVSADGQTWIDLGSPNGITIRLQASGDSTSVHGAGDLAAGTYTRVRLTLRNIALVVSAGANIGGVVLTSDTQINVGGSDRQVVIEKQVSAFTVTRTSTTRIVFELNTEVWMTAQNAQDRTVDDAEVAGAATAAVRAR